MIGNLEEAFKSGELAAATATERARVRMHSTGVIAMRDREQHCFDPWWIARCHPNAHRRASEGLAREGFEVWYPAGRLLKAMPHRLIGTKKRARKQHILREDIRFPYGDYLFLRRLFGNYDIRRLFDISGMIGLCLFGESAAYLHDFEIELMRLAEFDGRFDDCETPLSARDLMQAEIHQTDAVKERWNGSRVFSNILDGGRRSVLFVEEFGRITRTVASAGDIPGPNTLAPSTWSDTTAGHETCGHANGSALGKAK